MQLPPPASKAQGAAAFSHSVESVVGAGLYKPLGLPKLFDELSLSDETIQSKMSWKTRKA